MDLKFYSLFISIALILFTIARYIYEYRKKYKPIKQIFNAGSPDIVKKHNPYSTIITISYPLSYSKIINYDITLPREKNTIEGILAVNVCSYSAFSGFFCRFCHNPLEYQLQKNKSYKYYCLQCNLDEIHPEHPQQLLFDLYRNENSLEPPPIITIDEVRKRKNCPRYLKE